MFSRAVNVPIGEDMEVSCALMGDPVFTSSYLATHHNVGHSHNYVCSVIVCVPTMHCVEC